MISRNLEPGQYQIGAFVFGWNTLFNVEKFDIGGWEVNVQDSQAMLSDELRFGSDSFKPNPIQISLNARRNRLLPNIASITGESRDLNFDNDRRIGDFTREWRADEIRKDWGSLKPLYVCRPDGSVVMVYGRPGKIAVSREDPLSLNRYVVAEYRRSDTLCYNEFEWFLATRFGEQRVVYRTSDLRQGDAPSWVRFLLVGPMTHPIIQLGDITIELDIEMEPGDVIEINSYPWSRRVVRLNDGANLSSKLVQPYLEKLYFDVDTPYELSWNADDTNEQIEERDFNNYSNTTEGLPASDWRPTVYTGSGAGKYSLNNGILGWTDTGNEEYTGVSIFSDAATVTPYQLVRTTIPSPGETGYWGGPEPTNRIIGRSKLDASEYMFWEIGITEFWYGYCKDGVVHKLSPTYKFESFMNICKRIMEEFWNDVFGVSTNWTYEAEFGTGNSVYGSTLRINDTHAFTFNPPEGSLGQSAVNNRYTGLGMKATAGGSQQRTPGTLTGFSVRDNPPEPANVSTVYMFWQDAWQNI